MEKLECNGVALSCGIGEHAFVDECRLYILASIIGRPENYNSPSIAFVVYYCLQ